MVVRNCVQLGRLEWPYFEGIWKVCVCGFAGGEISVNVACSAPNVRAQCKGSSLVFGGASERASE